MCGIAGILYRDEKRPVHRADLRRMAAALEHRGPDDEGYFTEPGIGLAHRRLSIIDIEGGSQPMGNEDGSVQVVFNGEIYNYRRLQRELEQRGHRLKSQCDTEVLVHLYEDLGARLVEPLRGMFAFALWDRAKRRLLLGRDRIGLKPLYLYRDAEKLVFGSELKAILAHQDVPRRIDPAALDDYLTFGFVPGERAIFTGFRKLPAAHWLSVRSGDWDASPRCYWHLREPRTLPESFVDWQEAMEEKISETVAAHRIADVPVGAFLSGGLDSSAIVAAWAQQHRQPPRTFSIGFGDPERSELPYARRVAEQFGCPHTEKIVTPEAASSLDDLVHYYDEPFADSSAIPSLLVARVAREQVKVVLSGDGGDEAFGGYARYLHDLREARLRSSIPWWYRRSIIGPLAAAWPKADWLPRPLRARTMLTNLSLPAGRAYANTLSICREPLRSRLLAGDLKAQLGQHRPDRLLAQAYDAGRAGDALSCMTMADIKVLLPDDFLTKVDRASMACGLEVRPPFCDHQLLELAHAMPSDYKIHRGRSKWMLTELYRDKLPEEVIERPKQGFEIPTDQWLRGPLAECFRERVLSGSGPVDGLIDRSQAEGLFQRHQSGTSRYGNLLWSLLVLASWAERYLGPATATSEPREVTAG